MSIISSAYSRRGAQTLVVYIGDAVDKIPAASRPPPDTSNSDACTLKWRPDGSLELAAISVSFRYVPRGWRRRQGRSTRGGMEC